MKHAIFHSSSYYLEWIACILLAAMGYGVMAALCVLAILALQIAWLRHSQQKAHGLIPYMLIYFIVGSSIDTLFMHLGLITFNANIFSPIFSAPWMMSLWLSLSFNFYTIFSSWFNKYILSSSLALIGFPLAYRAGVAFGVATVSTPYFYLALGVTWAVLFPLINSFFQQQETRQETDD